MELSKSSPFKVQGLQIFRWRGANLRTTSVCIWLRSRGLVTRTIKTATNRTLRAGNSGHSFKGVVMSPRGGEPAPTCPKKGRRVGSRAGIKSYLDSLLAASQDEVFWPSQGEEQICGAKIAQFAGCQWKRDCRRRQSFAHAASTCGRASFLLIA